MIPPGTSRSRTKEQISDISSWGRREGMGDRKKSESMHCNGESVEIKRGVHIPVLGFHIILGKFCRSYFFHAK